MALDPAQLIKHVQDSPDFHLPGGGEHGTIVSIPQPLPPRYHEQFQLTRFMLIELVAAVLLVAIFVPLARKIRTGAAPRGRWWNLMESFLLFFRDEVVRPSIGHGADRFLPFIWTMFFFILGCNLLGLVPWLGSPTGSISVTGALASMTLVTVSLAGMMQFGFLGFFKNQVPHMDLPAAMAVLIKPMVFVIEVIGLLIRHFVLSVRLFANMFAGHLVLGTIIAFIGMAANQAFVLWASVTVASIGGALALSLLELFVAFLQAYIFAFLSALFIGMATHHH